MSFRFLLPQSSYLIYRIRNSVRFSLYVNTCLFLYFLNLCPGLLFTGPDFIGDVFVEIAASALQGYKSRAAHFKNSVWLNNRNKSVDLDPW